MIYISKQQIWICDLLSLSHAQLVTDPHTSQNHF